MGAWGTGPFENDDAADWAYDLEVSSDLTLVRATLNAAIEAEYLDAPAGGEAVAASAVVAACASGRSDLLPYTVVVWKERVEPAVEASDVELARRALGRVRGRASELRELWSDPGSASFEASLDEIEDVLGGGAKGPT